MTALPLPGDPRCLYLLDIEAWTRMLWEVARPTERDGERVEVVRGFASCFRDLMVKRRPALLGAVTADRGSPLARRAIWSGYKAGKASLGEAYETQIERIVELLGLHGVPVWRGSGFEAIDWIASAVRDARSIGLRVVVISKDRASWHFIEPEHVVVWDGKADTATGYDEVCAAYGVVPEQLVELWALAGRGDEAPGGEGIGEKTAAALLLKRGGLDEVLRKTAWEKPGLAKRLRDSAHAIALSRTLLTPSRDAPLAFDPSELCLGWGAAEAASICAIAEKLGIDAMLAVRASAKRQLDERVMRSWMGLDDDEA